MEQDPMYPEDDDADEDAEEVGYGKPPVATRFSKGQSGNPHGRPRGARDHKTILARVAFQERAYKEGSRTGRKTTLALVLLALRNATANGDLSGLIQYEALLARDEANDLPVPRGFLLIGEDLTEDEWDAKYNPDYVKPQA